MIESAIEKILFPYTGSFYITDVCNFTCSECLTYSNLPIKGHSVWANNQSMIQDLAEHVKFPVIELLGGEPLMHPELELWARGLRTLFPDTPFCIVTNGSYIPKCRGLYDLLLENQISLEVCWHGNDWENIKQNALAILKNPQSKDANPIDEGTAQSTHYHKNYDNYQSWIDENGVTITFSMYRSFAQTSNFVHNKFYNSDPNRAHENCPLKVCTEIREGRLYKCPVVPSILNANRQLNLNLAPDAIALLEEYEPMAGDWSYEKKKQWANNINQPIPQCRICPTKTILVKYNCDYKNSKKKNKLSN